MDKAVRERPCRILVVDDSPDACDALVALLRVWEHEVVAVATGDEALREAPLFRPDIAIFDLTLPDMDGCELAKAFRAEYVAPPFLIALSG